MNRPDALFLDIDGTILKSDHSLSDRMAEAIRAVKDAGTLVCLATGRSWEALKPFYDRIGLDGPTVCYNGAFIVDGPGGRRIFEVDLDEEVGRAAIDEARSRDMELVAFRHSHLVYEKLGRFVEGYHHRTKLHGSLVDFDAYEHLEFTKAIIIAEPEGLPPVKASLEARFGPDRLSAMYSDATFLELMAGGVNKGRGLREVCRLRGVDPGRTVAMGDGWNDLDLLEAAGEAWVMGGAPPELKARFPDHCIAPDSDNEGAARVLEAMVEERLPDFLEEGRASHR